ncbi:hypothetical protein D3C75_1362500 [compost metagenome]
MDIQAHAAERNIALFIKQIAQRAADHHAHQLSRIEVFTRQAADVLSVAQHAHAVR